MPQKTRSTIRIVAPLIFVTPNNNPGVVPSIFSNGKKDLHVNKIFAGYSITWVGNEAFVREMDSGPGINEELLRSPEVQKLRDRNFLVERVAE